MKNNEITNRYLKDNKIYKNKTINNLKSKLKMNLGKLVKWSLILIGIGISGYLIYNFLKKKE
ncbi:MAG: hypothetical protein GF329_15130 [Candidatus Lokiarchaeota archaeon]|nr:hypothetical protein [Candidatus Lokiarchaeota archaeon]